MPDDAEDFEWREYKRPQKQLEADLIELMRATIARVRCPSVVGREPGVQQDNIVPMRANVTTRAAAGSRSSQNAARLRTCRTSAQHGSTGVVHLQTWSTSDVSPGSRDGGGRGEYRLWRESAYDSPYYLQLDVGNMQRETTVLMVQRVFRRFGARRACTVNALAAYLRIFGRMDRYNELRVMAWVYSDGNVEIDMDASTESLLPLARIY
ncbi:hypothetical protein T492DRAFT_834769 [Pavlovales sp. CCMP2436]|nr:hypothetical protein T492DRAFT_834769 [Pavlovales sp. CCMP2436]